jgi:hypothetical protein
VHTSFVAACLAMYRMHVTFHESNSSFKFVLWKTKSLLGAATGLGMFCLLEYVCIVMFRLLEYVCMFGACPYLPPCGASVHASPPRLYAGGER